MNSTGLNEAFAHATRLEDALLYAVDADDSAEVQGDVLALHAVADDLSSRISNLILQLRS